MHGRHTAFAMSAISTLVFAGIAAAQVTTYQARPQWEAATSPLGVMYCEDIESDQLGNFPTPYSTQNGWNFVNGGEIPQSVQIIPPPHPLNATQAIAFRDNGGGVSMNSPCDPSVAMGFDYYTNSPWSITIGAQTFALNVGAPSFFGFTSGSQLQSVTFTSIIGGDRLILDNLCCIAGKVGPALGACCHLQQGVTVCSFVTHEECDALGGIFQGVGVPCDPNPCPIPGVGACCHQDATGVLVCSVVSVNECAALGGTYYGDGTSCAGIVCNPNAFGACCYENTAGVITCSIVTAQECTFVNGTYFGDNTVCDPNPCPVVPGNCEPVAGDCCAGRPNINDPFYQTFPPLVTVGTASPIANGPSVVNVFGIITPNAPLNADMGAPIYSHPTWTEQNLGPVFGVALDAGGNIYVTGTRAYGIWATGAPGALGGNYGIVYRLDSTTGIASIFAALPNANSTGLGNITYDCGNNQFFVTNMEDGMIYRLSAAGATLSTFDFGAADDPSNTFAPLGDRLWAVEVHNNRVYFSVWKEDAGNPSVADSNEIWSIALDGTGNFAGAPQLEVTVPPNPSSSYSNPVADMRFTPTGTMLLAERGMTSETEPTPHQSRLLEYECVGGNWVPSANTFDVGVINGVNTAGGVDMDFSAGGRIYATGDALQLGPDIIYGMQGLPATGGDTTTSTLIDFNGSLTYFDKTQIGSVAVPCPASSCLNVHQMKILCPTDTNTCFTATFNITNKSGQPVKYVTIPLHPTPNSPITINPNIINLLTQDGSLLEDGETTTITLTICNAAPGEEFCLTMGLVTPGFVICCFEEVCFEMPECDCGQLLNQEILEVQCPEPGQVTFTYNFTLENLAGFPADWVIFVPHKDETAYFAKDFFFLPPLVPGSSIPMSVTIVGATPGEEFCFSVLMQHPGSPSDCCCAFEKCIIIPDCEVVPSVLCRADFNNDQNVSTPDLLTVINSWGPCPTTCPPGCLADLDNNCNVGVADLLQVINTWGPCPVDP